MKETDFRGHFTSGFCRSTDGNERLCVRQTGAKWVTLEVYLLMRGGRSPPLRLLALPVEVIVVDDSPEGSALPVIEDMREARVTFLKNIHPAGGIPSIVRNIGWPRAKGSFVHFLDDDDIVPDRHYLAVKDAFSDHPQAGWFLGRVEPFGECEIGQLERERHYPMFPFLAHKPLIFLGPEVRFVTT